MKMTKIISLAVLALFLVSTHHAFGVTGTQLTIQGNDATLRWPSSPGEVFIIAYRPTLDPSTPWTLLETSYGADATGTETTFIHEGVVVYPPPPEGGGGGDAISSSDNKNTKSWNEMTEEERVARREELYKQAQESAEYLMRLLKEAIAKAEADRERWEKEGFPIRNTSESDSQPMDGADGSDPQPLGSMGFYTVVELGEDIADDLLSNDWDVTHTYLTSGSAIREEFDVELPTQLSSPSGFAGLTSETIDTQLAAYGNDNDGIGGMYARVVAGDGTVQIRFYSVFVEGSFFAASGSPLENFGLTPEELQQLGNAYGPGTRSRSGLFSTPNQSQLQQIPTQTLEKAADLHAGKAKEFWIKANNPNLSTTQRRVYIDAVDTQVSRYNAVRRAAGRVGQALLPLAIVGGVMVAIDAAGSSQELIDAARAYHSAAVNGDDLCDPAIDVAIWAHNVAPGSFNFVWDYLCP
jgi:hypothetical protein